MNFRELKEGQLLRLQDEFRDTLLLVVERVNSDLIVTLKLDEVKEEAVKLAISNSRWMRKYGKFKPFGDYKGSEKTILRTLFSFKFRENVEDLK
jgi:hypothetical protein